MGETMTTTTTDPAGAFGAAIAGAGLPGWLAWSVKVSTRRPSAKPTRSRRTLGATIEPGGSVVFTVAAGTTPEEAGDAVRRMRGRLVVAAEDKRDRGVRIVRKELVDGEGFPFAGRYQRLRLVVDGDERDDRTAAGPLTRHPGVPIIAEPGPSTWSGIRTHQLTMRRDAASARTVIEWYRTQGQAWLDEHVPPLLSRVYVKREDWPTWEVRPARRGEGYGGSWGRYRWPAHSMTVPWLIFQLPAELLRYIAAHEVAHAALKGQHGHAQPWQLVVSRLCPDWRELDPRARELPGLPLWVGELEPARESVAPVAADPFVSGWASLPA